MPTPVASARIYRRLSPGPTPGRSFYTVRRGLRLAGLEYFTAADFNDAG